MSRFGWPNVLPVGFSSAVRHALRVALAIVILLGLADPWSVARASPPGKAGGPGKPSFRPNAPPATPSARENSSGRICRASPHAATQTG